MEPEELNNLADHGDSASEIAEEIRGFQAGLKEYVAGLLGGADGVDDLVQETNLFLWERREEFLPGSNFRAWAMRVAWFKVMAERRDRLREGRVVFSEPMLEQLAARAAERLGESDQRLDALRRCLDRSRPQDRRILEWKYSRRASLTELAEANGCAPNAMHKMISRLRLALRHCVEKQLGNEHS
ncbi:sigma-70 family RNA polymerase sigma factor [Luteolibacter arcticus]|uniref:Sigma-70 family RNA polymerase sigma factor n=1 Tax=Luteolibacter arcticus TaxID=1581411 RepID=A0ABT3GE53_9BACT|nr:sigma-70 family RNA polymerase sigma factor [Luteolibacter arcticus]MCW1921899.1 sigma-70 family RNA polymerase sigma factor [Luteolibacter arcticus]